MKILVCDDHSDLLTLVSMMLKSMGHESVICESGREAEFLASSERPDVILLDMMMPVQDGWETLRNLREQGYSGRIVIMSAYATNTEPLRALEAGANGYIRKPILREKLAQVLSVTHQGISVIELSESEDKS